MAFKLLPVRCGLNSSLRDLPRRILDVVGVAFEFMNEGGRPAFLKRNMLRFDVDEYR